MARVLKFDGRDTYCLLNTPLSLTGDFELEVKFLVNFTAAYYQVVFSVGHNNTGFFGGSKYGQFFFAWGNYFIIPGFEFGVPWTVNINRVGSTVEVFANGSLIQTFSNSTTLEIPALGNLNGTANGLKPLDGYIEHFKVTGLINLSAEASDPNLIGVQPVMVDTIGANVATGVGFATDGSAWVDLGGGTEEPPVDLISVYTLPSLTFSVDIESSKPSISSNVNYNLPSLGLAAIGESTRPSIYVEGQYQLPSITVGASTEDAPPVIIVVSNYTLPSLVTLVNMDGVVVSLESNTNYTLPSLNIVGSVDQVKPTVDVDGVYTLPSLYIEVNTLDNEPGISSVGAYILPSLSVDVDVTYKPGDETLSVNYVLPNLSTSIDIGLEYADVELSTNYILPSIGISAVAIPIFDSTIGSDVNYVLPSLLFYAGSRSKIVDFVIKIDRRPKIIDTTLNSFTIKTR